ncbi:MAG: hypothetical protein RL712_1151 [Bacteroidota bacterium]
MKVSNFALPTSPSKTFVNWAICLLFPTLLLLQSCEDQVIGPPLVAPLGDERVAVLCEGNFMWGNAKLDVISTDTGGTWIWNNAFESVNSKPIGDVLQSGLVTTSFSP